MLSFGHDFYQKHEFFSRQNISFMLMISTYHNQYWISWKFRMKQPWTVKFLTSWGMIGNHGISLRFYQSTQDFHEIFQSIIGITYHCYTALVDNSEEKHLYIHGEFSISIQRREIWVTWTGFIWHVFELFECSFSYHLLFIHCNGVFVFFEWNILSENMEKKGNQQTWVIGEIVFIEWKILSENIEKKGEPTDHTTGLLPGVGPDIPGARPLSGPHVGHGNS